AANFSFQPLPAIQDAVQQPSPAAASPLGPLGPLAGLAGTWTGRGFNVIWRPNHTPSAQDHFLELNVTSEQLESPRSAGRYPTAACCSPTSACPA
ncbi:MAG: hypothetical protein ACRDOH_06160, partial [Streptosporangiaceae bacterium]